MQCPNCQTEHQITEAHYGALYTCNSCQAVYFINFEGKPEFSNDVPETINIEPSAPVTAPAAAAPQPISPMTDSLTMPSLETQPLQETSSFEPIPAVQDFGLAQVDPMQTMDLGTTPLESQPIAEPIPVTPESNMVAPVAEPAAAAPEPEMPAVDLSNPDINPFEAMAAAETTKQTAKPKTFSEVAGEISNFGNTEVQLAGLNYDLKITGIDTQETMKLFIEAIQDSKLGWDHNEIVKNIKNGSIEFTKLNPVKAYVLAKRIQFLDVEKQWKQNVLS